jgi:hypothetical protein
MKANELPSRSRVGSDYLSLVLSIDLQHASTGRGSSCVGVRLVRSRQAPD